MSNPTTLQGERILLRTRTQDWEGTVIEGPQIIWNGTRLYIIFSANHYTTEDYCLGMMYIDDLKDPLVAENWNQKLDGPVFYKNTDAGVYGPGHASFTYSPDLKEGWIAYHAMQVPQMPVDHDNRTTRVERYDWSAEGLPVFPRPSGLGTVLESPSGTDETITTTTSMISSTTPSDNSNLGQTLVTPTILTWTAIFFMILT